MTVEELARRQASLDVDECHHVAVQAYWSHEPPLSRRRAEGEHVRLRALASTL